MLEMTWVLRHLISSNFLSVNTKVFIVVRGYNTAVRIRFVPYEGKLKSHTVKKVIGMFIPQNRNGQEKMVSVSVVKEDRIIYISKDMFKIYEQSLSEPDGIQLKRTFF